VQTFAGLILDVDSTLTSVEGIQWLAARRGPAIAQRVAEMTDGAMLGTVPLDDVYGARLALVRPTRADVTALAEAYEQGTVPGVQHTLSTVMDCGLQITVISGGIREAVLPFAESLRIPADRVHAVSLSFGAGGEYVRYDMGSPLARRGGKPELVHSLGLARPVLALGDGSTDAELKTRLIAGQRTVDGFAAFIGVAERAPVVAVADYVVRRFTELPSILLGEAAA